MPGDDIEPLARRRAGGFSIKIGYEESVTYFRTPSSRLADEEITAG
jgi:hypothetical protein